MIEIAGYFFSSLLFIGLLTTLLPSTLRLFADWEVGNKLFSREEDKKGSQSEDVDDKQVEVTHETEFPGDWWTSEKHFALEKRAIFSKSWLYAAHASNLVRAGDYISITLPGNFPIFLIKGKDKAIRAFHNVCRHRAYAVTTKPSGSSLVLGCKYHGWSYDTRGKLVKAPKFEGVPGFDKAQNGLFEVHCQTDANGFVFVNLDAGVDVSPPPNMERFRGIGSEVRCIEQWEIEASLNWKFSELTEAFGALAETRNTDDSFLRRLSGGNGPNVRLRPTSLAHIFLIPRTRLLVSISSMPLSAQRTRFQCAIYSTTSIIPSGSPELAQTKANISYSVSKMEQAFTTAVATGEIIEVEAQAELLENLKQHCRLERLAGREINPAGRESDMSGACKVADDLCKELESNPENGPLIW